MKEFRRDDMIYPNFLLIVILITLYAIYKMLASLSMKNINGRNEAGIFSSRLYVCSLVGMFSAWFLYWMNLISTAAAQGKQNPYAGNLSNCNIIPVCIMGIGTGIVVGLLSRKWSKLN
jgi:hypothetical protein